MNKSNRILAILTSTIITLCTIAVFVLYFCGVLKVSSWLFVSILGILISTNLLSMGGYLADKSKKNYSVWFTLFGSVLELIFIALFVYLAITQQISF